LSTALTDFASIDQFEAARTGNLAWFQHHKAVGTLPDLNLCDDDSGWFPLDLAARHGHLSVVRYLIEESGQSIDVTAHNNFALRYAARHGHLPVVRYLIEESNQPVDVFANDNKLLRTAADTSSFVELRTYLETVIPIIESLGLDLAREFFKSQLSITSKNTDASFMKGRI
jgi:ankyrin repeat protein